MQSEQMYRLENARENLAAARLLVEHHYYDIAVSRAYYAMFYTAEALLLEHGLAFPQHEPVLTHFNQHFAQTSQGFKPYYQYLVEGYQSRIQADYRPLIQAQRSEAMRQIKRAKRFLATAQEYFSVRVAC